MRCTAFGLSTRRILDGVLQKGFLILLLILSTHSPSIALDARGYEYVSPIPGSQLVSRWNNIVIRPGGSLAGRPIDAAALSVVGSQTGAHAGRLVLSDDRRTLVFRPSRPFALGEQVRVRFDAAVTSRKGGSLPPLEFTFAVDGAEPMPPRDPIALEAAESPVTAARSRSAPPLSVPTGDLANSCTPLPTDYPLIFSLVSNQPDPGAIFVSPFGGPPAGRLMIVDNYCKPLFYRRLRSTAFDFKRQPSGLLTYYCGTQFYGLDSTYAVVDSFMMGNGYSTDVHDLQVLPDGHALLMAYNNRAVHMDSIVPGGNPNAQVAGLIIQEIDLAKNVVFQWRSWDHFLITDADTCLINLRAAYVDYVHGNAVELDTDGNLMISCRHMDEITKIDRLTGDIIWRLGSHAVNNQFSFPNDPRGFTAQHDIRRLPNGHITLFDNGNCVTPIYSRALEYELDEVNKVATLVWEYRKSPDVYGGFMGNVQRRTNGATMVGWGGTGALEELTDLHADGTVALSVSIGGSSMYSYRAYRFPWSTSMFAVTPDTADFGQVVRGEFATQWVTVRNRSSQPLAITCVEASDPSFTVVTALPVTIGPAGTADFLVRAQGTSFGDHLATLYVRTSNDTSLVAQTTNLKMFVRATLPGTTPLGLGLLAAGLLGAAAVGLARRRARGVA
jgi:hypothetical protein